MGLRVKAVFNDWPTLQRKVNNKQSQMYIMGWVADYPDAEDFLQLFYSGNIDKGTNNSNYRNPVFDSLYERVRVMQDSPARTAIYATMIRIISEECPVMLDIRAGKFRPVPRLGRTRSSSTRCGYGFFKYRRHRCWRSGSAKAGEARLMGRYVLRRLVQAVFTVFGVMLITFILFRVIAGDVSSAYVNQKLGAEAKRAFNEKHKLDRPGIFNFHRRLGLVDHTAGSAMFSVPRIAARRRGRAVLSCTLRPGRPERKALHPAGLTMVGRLVFDLSPQHAACHDDRRQSRSSARKAVRSRPAFHASSGFPTARAIIDLTWRRSKPAAT